MRVENTLVSAAKVKDTSRTTLDKHAFLKLLTYQLRYQNPLEPLNDRELATQLAQFSTLEEMQNLNKSILALLLLQAGSLLGKTVNLKDGTSGVVEGITLQNEVVYLTIQGENHPLTDLAGVTEK